MAVDARGVCEMQMSRKITVCAKRRDGVVEAMYLIESQRLARSVVRRGKVRHHSIDAQVGKLLQQRDKLADLIDAYAEPAHARVDFHMHVRNRARFPSRVVERFEHVATINNR